MVRALVIVCGLLLAATSAGATQLISMRVGEIKIMRLKPIERVAVGSSEIVSQSLLKNGQLLLLAEGAGATTVHLWFEDGLETEYAVEVSEIHVAKPLREIKEALQDVDGLIIEQIGDTIVLKGGIHPQYSSIIAALTELNPNVRNLTVVADSLVRELLAGVEGVEVSVVGPHVVLRGDIHPYDRELVEKVLEKSPEVLDLTSSSALPEDKMILMNVKITEFNKNKLQNLGIDWDNPIAGPSAALAVDVAANETFRPVATTPAFGSGLPVDLTTDPLGFFGIATEISSRINFLVNSGDALILAEPRLSTRSGGKATFLAGGEIPLPTTGSLGQSNVEFKEFGISMDIEPVVDRHDNILATVSTELSAVDSSVAVQGIPGFLTRKTSTDVSMRAGETLVISGLINQETAKDINKLKFFGDIPVLGALFRSTNFRNRNTELVIFVTPTVYDANSEVNQANIRRSREKLDGFAEEIDEKNLQIID